MTQETYTPFADLVGELKTVCDEGRTGVFFVATKANRSAQLMIDEGRIVYVYFFNKRGADALKLMTEIIAGRFRFQEGSINAAPMELPPTSEILAYLLTAAEGRNPTEPGPESKVKTEQAGSGFALTSDQKSILEEVLAVYIGPMAAIICEDHLDSVTDLESAINALASEIPSSDQVSGFMDEARRKLA